MKNFSFIALIVLLLASAACSTDCFEPTDAKLNVAFIDSASLKEYKIANLTVQGVGSDSVLYLNTVRSGVSLPLKQDTTVTEYTFSIIDAAGANSEVFNLYVGHIPHPQLITPECGCTMNHQVDSIRFYNDSIERKTLIYNSAVSNVENQIHVKIYF